MSELSQLLTGIILLSIPSIMFGGYFLLQIRSGKQEHLGLTPYQKAMFKAGHAHAGVLILLAIIAQPLCDVAALPFLWDWVARLGFMTAPLLISGGFFGAAGAKGATSPGPLIALLYAGMAVLATALVTLGLGLVL